MSIITSEISNILERVNGNESKHAETLKMIKTENMGTKKIMTEMVNNRMIDFEKLLRDYFEDVMRKFGGLQKEKEELKEKLAEIQTELKEKNSNDNPKRNRKSSESDDDHPRKKKSSGSSSSEKENNKAAIKKVSAYKVLEKLREPEIEERSANGKIERNWYSIDIYIQKYAQLIQEMNEYNGLLLAQEFNNNEQIFKGIYYYPKELYTKDLSVGMKTVMKENGIHPHPFKYICGMQQCTSQFRNKVEHIEYI
jgi:hypothetical protein